MWLSARWLYSDPGGERASCCQAGWRWLIGPIFVSKPSSISTRSCECCKKCQDPCFSLFGRFFMISKSVRWILSEKTCYQTIALTIFLLPMLWFWIEMRSVDPCWFVGLEGYNQLLLKQVNSKIVFNCIQLCREQWCGLLSSLKC